MSGFSDGVSKVFKLEHIHGSMCLDGFDNKLEMAIQMLREHLREPLNASMNYRDREVVVTTTIDLLIKGEREFQVRCQG